MCYYVSERFLNLLLPPALRPKRLAYRHDGRRATMLVYKNVRNVGCLTVPVGLDPAEWNDVCDIAEGGYACLCCPVRTLIPSTQQAENRPLTPTIVRE